MVPWAHPSLRSNRHIDRFSRFCRTHERNQQTDKHAYRPRYCVYSNEPHLAIAAMRSITYSFNNNCHTAIVKQSNRIYQTSTALCNPTTRFAADRPHRLRPEIFRILFALAWHTEWSLLLHDAIDDWMIPFAANAAATLQCPAAAKIPNAFKWPGQPQKIALSH